MPLFGEAQRVSSAELGCADGLAGCPGADSAARLPQGWRVQIWDFSGLLNQTRDLLWIYSERVLGFFKIAFAFCFPWAFTQRRRH